MHVTELMGEEGGFHGKHGLHGDPHVASTIPLTPPPNRHDNGRPTGQSHSTILRCLLLLMPQISGVLLFKLYKDSFRRHKRARGPEKKGTFNVYFKVFGGEEWRERPGTFLRAGAECPEPRLALFLCSPLSFLKIRTTLPRRVMKKVVPGSAQRRRTATALDVCTPSKDGNLCRLISLILLIKTIYNQPRLFFFFLL